LPLHAQAEILLRKMIRKSEYTDGGLLPDEVSLSRSLGISRNTLRAAIGRLVAEGRLERKAGIGTRVAEPRVDSGIGAWHSFTREMEAKGIKVETYSVNAKTVVAPMDAARALQIPPGSKILRLDRVRGWDGKPEACFKSFFHPRLGLTLLDDFQGPLYEMIHKRCSMIADESIERLSAVNADRSLAKMLAVAAGTALLCRERVVLDAGRRPMEYAIVHYRCDRFTLTLNLHKQ